MSGRLALWGAIISCGSMRLVEQVVLGGLIDRLCGDMLADDTDMSLPQANLPVAFRGSNHTRPVRVEAIRMLGTVKQTHIITCYMFPTLYYCTLWFLV